MLSRDEWGQEASFDIGQVWLPKGVKLKDDSSPPMLTNDGFAEWENLIAKDDSPSMEFKPIADASVDTHVASALWIAKIGERFDALLSPNVYGSRVTRYGRQKKYNISSTSSLVHYPAAYRAWRKNGLAAIRNAIEHGADVVAITMDFSNFFGNIDSEFLIKPEFHALVKGLSPRHQQLDDREFLFTTNLIKVFARYRRGLPIGLTASSVMANIFLLDFDRRVAEALAPIYYGRYMDDVFIVVANVNRMMKNSEDIKSYVRLKFNALGAGMQISKDDNVIIDKRVYGRSRLRFNLDKQRHFLLDHNAGHDIVAMLEDKLDEISSERRRLPDKSITMSASAKALALSVGTGEDVDFTGRVDRVTIRRLGLANIVGAFLRFSKMFRPNEWAAERTWLLRLSIDQVMPPHRLFSLAKYVPRIISIFVAAGDWEHATKALLTMKRTLHYIVSERFDRKLQAKFRSFYDFMCRWAIEEAISAAPFSWKDGRMKILYNAEKEIGRFPGILRSRLSDDDALLPSLEGLCNRLSSNLSLLYWADVAHAAPAEEIGRNNWKSKGRSTGTSQKAFSALSNKISGYQKGFEVLFCNQKPSVKLPPKFLMFPTRRMSQIEICRQNPDIPLDIANWRNANRFARGINWIPRKPPYRPPEEKIRRIDDRLSAEETLVAVANIATSDLDWSKSLTEPNHGRERYDHLVPVINSVIQSFPKPDYVVFPELSIPANLADLFGLRLASSGISSIMGVEYVMDSPRPSGLAVRNGVNMYLVDKQLGYSSVVFQREDKGSPAVHEREELRKTHDATLSSDLSRDVPIYMHGGLCFAILICSELTNIKYRARLAGAIDLLIVPSWNQDTTTFSSLVESAALDLHCFVAVANNQRFGDSRIRGPYKEHYLRDIVRLHSGIHDLVAAGKLPIETLRKFQAYHISPESPFKPVPDGFAQSPWRKGRPLPLKK